MSAKGVVKLTLCKLPSFYLIKLTPCGTTGRGRVPLHTGAVQKDGILLSPSRDIGEDGALNLMVYLYY